MKDRLSRYFKGRVEVRAGGIIYSGLLVGADEEFMYLKGETTWITLPMEAVTAVRKKGEAEAGWDIKEVEGAPKRGGEDREEKRLYSASDLEKLHQGADSGDWPEGPKDPDGE